MSNTLETVTKAASTTPVPETEDKSPLKRLSLLNLIAEVTGAQRYLEIGVAEGNTLTKVEVPHRIGVDPAPRYYAMDETRLKELEQVELHESESDHFFFHNNRTFDLVFVDGLHLYEQAMKDILNALDCLNPGGFVVVHDLIPKEAAHAARDRETSEWNGDVWKVVFDVWKHHPGIDYFVVDSDAGMGVMWKKDESDRFAPSWKPEVRDLEYTVMEAAGKDFLNRTPSHTDEVRELIKKATTNRKPLPDARKTPAGLLRIEDGEEFSRLMDDPAAPDGFWIMEEESYNRIDPAKFHSNYHLDVFRKTVCTGTGGNIMIPQKKAYLLHDAKISPCVAGNGKWPFRWHIQDRQGNFIEDVLQRRDINAPRTYEFNSPKKLEGRYLYLGWFAPYFGHFFTEMLIQLQAVQLMGGRDFKILFNAEPGEAANWLNSTSPLKDFVISSLKHFSIELDDIIFIEEDVQVETLIAPTPPNVYQRGCRKEIFPLAREIRQTVFGDAGHTPKHIYLSRSNFNGRRLINGEQIEALFKARGFEIIYPETLPLEEQLALAAGAEVIAGEEGSAFCAGLFANNPIIVELESGRFHSNLPKLSYMNAKDYGYILPYNNLKHVPPARNNSMTYAHPWVVDETLASLFGSNPVGEAICGPREIADTLQEGTYASLTGNMGVAIQSLLKVMEIAPDQFHIQWVEHFLTNLKQLDLSEQDEATFKKLSAQLLRAYKLKMQQ